MDWALISKLPATAISQAPKLRSSSNSSFSPTSTTLLDLTGHIIREDDYYSAHGGSADIWKGTLLQDTGKCKVRLMNYFISVYPCPQPTSRKVAIKVIRANSESENSPEKINKVGGPLRIVLQVVHTLAQRLHKEILVWHKLDHENILPLLGITFDFGRGNPMGMVCPWVDNGNLNGYLERYQTTLSLRDRFRTVSTEEHFPLHDNGFDALYASFARWPLVYCIVSEMPWVITQMLKCVAVHSFDVVHGDLTGVRILRRIYSHAHRYFYQVKYSH